MPLVSFFSIKVVNSLSSAALSSKSCLLECLGDFAYSPPTTPLETTPIGKLNITTCNLALFTPALDTARRVSSLFSLSPDLALKLAPPIERAPNIAKQLNSCGSSIICGQEVFCAETEKILREVLDSYHVITRVGAKQSVVQTSSSSSSTFWGKISSAIAPLQLSSGVFFASHFPIIKSEIRFRRFTNLVIEDKLATKGVLRVPLEVPLKDGSKKSIIFFVTHLQAQKEYQKVRAEQLGSLLQWIEEDQKANPTALCFLAGDLNVSSIEEDGKTSKEKEELHWFFSQFLDFYAQDSATAHTGQPTGSFYDMSKFGQDKEIPGCRYDYTLLYTGGNKVEMKWQTEIRRFLNGLSDHLPLTTALEF